MTDVQTETATAGTEPDRAEFLAGVSNEPVRRAIETLGDFPYRLDRLFPGTEGWRVGRQVKKRVKLVKLLEPLLPSLLYPDETIHFVTRGVLNSFVEQYFMGLFAHLLNRTVFVVTNYRVILLAADGKGRPRQWKWQIPFDQIRTFKGGGFLGSTLFHLANHKKYKFSGVPSADRKFLHAYVNEHVSQAHDGSFVFPHYQSRDNLCPACCTPVEPKSAQCSECGDRFMVPMVPTLMSLCLPCLGDFYMGHRGMATLELLGYGFIWLFLFGLLASEGISALPVVLFALAIEHGVDAALTYHVARKGLCSTSRAWRGD